MITRKALHEHFNPDSVPAQIVEHDVKLEEPTTTITPENTEKEKNQPATQYSQTHIDNTEVELNIGN